MALDESARPENVDPGRRVGTVEVGRKKMGQRCLSSLVPAALGVLARDPMPEPSICVDRSRHGACKNIPQGAIRSRHPLGEQGCQSHGREGAATSDKQTPTHAAPTLDF